MSKVTAVLGQIEAEQLRQQVELIPDNIPLIELADMVVRGKVKLSPAQQRMLIEMLPFVAPKLTAVAHSVSAIRLPRGLIRRLSGAMGRS